MSETRLRRWPKVLGAVVAALVVATAIGVVVLDRVILSVAQARAAALSAQLGRTVAVEGVATRLLGGLGVKVTGLSVGPGPGEDVPLAQVGRAEVSVGLLRALSSHGRDILVREAVVQGLRVNVVKLSDGLTNVERLSRRLEELQAKEEPRPVQPAQASAPPSRPPPSIEVGRAALEDARVAFIDRTVKGAPELYVDHLDAEVRDLRVGRPVQLVVKAAVQAARQNLELRVRSAPLPASLVPVPEELTLQVQPVDLGPFAPFLPASVGLRGGRFQADLQAALGAAVPGGQGKTRVRGGFRATQLAFTGQGGGKRLDASLDADLSADAAAGDLDLGRLEVAIGPARLSGHGRASGLKGATPKVEGLEITSHGLDPAELAEYYPPLRQQLGGVVVAGPIGLALRGQGTQASQRLEVRVDLGPVRLLVPGQLEKAAGAPLLLTAGADAAQGGGRIRFDADLELSGVDLRPGGAVAKKPGDPLSVKLAGSYQKAAARTQVDLSRLAVDLLGDPLVGKGQVTQAGEGRARTTRFDAELSGERLDVDRLLLASGPAAKPARKSREPAGKGEGPARPRDHSVFAGLSGEARLRLGLLRVRGAELRNVLAKVKVQEDLVTLEQAQLQAFGGSVDAAGTTVRLAHPDQPFKVVTRVKGVAAEQALGLFTSQKLLSGSLDMALELSGPGTGGAAPLQALTGTLQGTLRDGAFLGKDLVAAAAAPLAGKLPFVKKVGEGGATRLGKEVPFDVRIADGVARLNKPLRIDAGDGQITLGGGVRLDGALEMPTTVALAPQFVSRITGGKVTPSAPIPLTFRLAGPARSPRLEGLSVDAAAKAIASEAAAGAVERALGLGSGDRGGAGAKDTAKQDAAKKLQDEARRRLKGLFGK